MSSYEQLAVFVTPTWDGVLFLRVLSCTVQDLLGRLEVLMSPDIGRSSVRMTGERRPISRLPLASGECPPMTILHQGLSETIRETLRRTGRDRGSSRLGYSKIAVCGEKRSFKMSANYAADDVTCSSVFNHHAAPNQLEP